MSAPQEIELKLLVLLPTASVALQRLRKVPALRRRTPQTQHLVNRYFDTPAWDLQRQRVALRLRQTNGQHWRQTLKTAGSGHGGLSVRGEWDSAVPEGQLQRAALVGTAWDTLDPTGDWFAQLHPCFETRCERTTWQVRSRDGSHVEVALDAGLAVAGDRTHTWLELELELLAGAPERLLELAQHIVQVLPVLPSDMSKAERGYALASQRLHLPTKAQAVALPKRATPAMLAAPVLAEILGQWQRNLEGLLHSPDPELVHQARVAWRRWRSVLRLLRPWLPLPAPDHLALQPLLDALGQLRDLDVALHDTLPPWAHAYQQGHDEGASQRAQHWSDALHTLEQAAQWQRQRVRQALAEPAVGSYLLAVTVWLHHLSQAAPHQPAPASNWATQRLKRWHRRLGQLLALARSSEPEQIHDARLLAKRLRYASEAIRAALPASQVQRSALWARQASQWQETIGRQRDTEQALLLLQRHAAADELIGFMRGVVSSQASH